MRRARRERRGNRCSGERKSENTVQRPGAARNFTHLVHFIRFEGWRYSAAVSDNALVCNAFIRVRDERAMHIKEAPANTGAPPSTSQIGLVAAVDVDVLD